MVVENVKGAQPWVGRARWAFGSFYLWGDVPALMPIQRYHQRLKVKAGEQWNVNRANYTGTRGWDETKNAGGSWFAVSHNNAPHSRGDGVKQTGSGRAWFDKALDERRKNPDGLKNPGIELGDIGFNVASAHQFGHMVDGVKIKRTEQDRRQHIGTKRKFASAMIAKIPFELSRHIARTAAVHRVAA